MGIDTHHCFKKNNRILLKEINGVPALIDMYRRTQMGLNPTALEIWLLLDGCHSVCAIIEKLKEEFDVDVKMLERDILGFFRDLIRREMIQ